MRSAMRAAGTSDYLLIDISNSFVKLAFATTGTIHQGDALTWAERELIAAVAAREGQCLY